MLIDIPLLTNIGYKPPVQVGTARRTNILVFMFCNVKTCTALFCTVNTQPLVSGFLRAGRALQSVSPAAASLSPGALLRCPAIISQYRSITQTRVST